MVVAVVSVDIQLYLLSSGLTTLSMVAAWQSWRLRKIYRSRSSLIGVVTFVLLGGRQAYVLFRLKNNIAAARAKGLMIESLTTEQWIVSVLWAFAIMIGFVTWQHWQHRELKALGI